MKKIFVFVKQGKKLFRNISTNVHFGLGAYNVHNKRLVKIRDLLKSHTLTCY